MNRSGAIFIILALCQAGNIKWGLSQKAKFSKSGMGFRFDLKLETSGELPEAAGKR